MRINNCATGVLRRVADANRSPRGTCIESRGGALQLLVAGFARKVCRRALYRCFDGRWACLPRHAPPLRRLVIECAVWLDGTHSRTVQAPRPKPTGLALHGRMSAPARPLQPCVRAANHSRQATPIPAPRVTPPQASQSPAAMPAAHPPGAGCAARPLCTRKLTVSPKVGEAGGGATAAGGAAGGGASTAGGGAAAAAGAAPAPPAWYPEQILSPRALATAKARVPSLRRRPVARQAVHSTIGPAAPARVR